MPKELRGYQITEADRKWIFWGILENNLRDFILEDLRRVRPRYIKYIPSLITSLKIIHDCKISEIVSEGTEDKERQGG